MLSHMALRQSTITGNVGRNLLGRWPIHHFRTSTPRTTSSTRLVLSFQRLSFSTATGGPLRLSVTKAATKAERQSWSKQISRLVKVVKFVRIPFLVVSVWTMGRQQGIIESVRNPKLVEYEISCSVLGDVGVTDPEAQVLVLSSDDKVKSDTKEAPLMIKTIQVGNDILRVARLYVREELQRAYDNLRETAPSDVTTEEFKKLCRNDEHVQFWTKALYRVEGEDPNVPWRYLLLDTATPNAFVSELLPKRVFITAGMFHCYIANEDELAVILGHELSHLILGHTNERFNMETFLRTAEVFLLSIDPTEGLVSLGVIGGLAWLRGILMASFTRENETEADALGVQLAARACYDTRKGCLVMKKMHDQQSPTEKSIDNSKLLTMMDTHPPSLERYEKIQQLSETEHPGKYNEACGTVYRRMTQAIFK